MVEVGWLRVWHGKRHRLKERTLEVHLQRHLGKQGASVRVKRQGGKIILVASSEQGLEIAKIPVRKSSEGRNPERFTEDHFHLRTGLPPDTENAVKTALQSAHDWNRIQRYEAKGETPPRLKQWLGKKSKQ